jgi:hypothetical protein
VPLLESLHAWLLSQLAQLSQGYALAKAIRYAIKPTHWPALTYYCTDAQVEIDNNAAARLQKYAQRRPQYAGACFLFCLP